MTTKVAILKKGTVIKLQGIPYTLEQDTVISGANIKTLITQ